MIILFLFLLKIAFAFSIILKIKMNLFDSSNKILIKPITSVNI